MQEALFNPLHGYYRTKNPIGKKSDFITSPEISQVFGEILAAYFLAIFSDKKTKITLVEIGSGSGTLFLDVLFSLQKLAQKQNQQALDFLKKTSFHIIEINLVLKEIQREKLKNFPVFWHQNFAEFLQKTEDEKAEIALFSNEFFDCFPIDQFVKTNLGWQEKLVGIFEDELAFTLAKFDLAIDQLIEKILLEETKNIDFDSYKNREITFEYSFQARSCMTEISESLAKRGGIAINFDYGYFENDFANSLQAIKNHQKTNPLKNVGDSDITALVDFASFDKIAKKFLLNSSLISQKDFLLSLGVEERRKSLIAKNPNQKEAINSSIDRLISDNEMGRLFKCHIIWKP